VSGRHRADGDPVAAPVPVPAPGARRVPAIVVAMLALAAVTAVTLRIVAASAAGCSGSLELRVAAAPEIAPVLTEIGAKWLDSEPDVGGQCVSLNVRAIAPAAVASELTVFAGSAIDVADVPAPTPLEQELPAVWVPDSTAWLRRVQVVDRRAFADDARSVASSPVVVAMPEAAATQVGWPANPLRLAGIKPLLGAGGPLRLGIAEPRRESASLAGVMLLGSALATSDAELPSLIRTFRTVRKTASTTELLAAFGPEVNAGPVAEQALVTYNATNPPLRLVAVQVDPVAPHLDYPYAVRAELSREVARAAELFRDAVLADGAGPLARAAFRGPDGVVGPGFPLTAATSAEPAIGTPIDAIEPVARALGLWTAANSPSRTLALFDVTESMGERMRTADGREPTRSQVMAAAARGGLDLFTTDSRVGMWAIADGHQEVLPIDDLTDAHKRRFADRLAGASPSRGSRSDLYTTLLAAYKEILSDYDPTRPNIIVVLTDGGDSSPGGVRREKFKQDLQRLAVPTKPVRVVIIGIAVGRTDAADLKAIADVVGGGFFPLTSPEQIQTIFLRALLAIGPA
jgi:hypothetical protein